MERQPRSHADVTKRRRHASGNTQEFRTQQTEKNVAEAKKHVEKLSKVVDGVEYFVGNKLTRANLIHILKSENAKIKPQQPKLYYLQKCASHNENTQKWITKDANMEDITMKGFKIKMPMLSTIEVATVADTSKQANKSPTTVHTKTKKKGRPSKNVGKGATTGAENNNENTDVNGTPIETDQSEKIAEELEAWELFNFTLNDDKVNWCEREFFARWEAYNGKLPLPLYGKELLDMEDNNDNTGWATLSRKRNNKKKAADEKRKTSDPIKLSSKPARKKVPAKTKAPSSKPTKKSSPKPARKNSPKPARKALPKPASENLPVKTKTKTTMKDDTLSKKKKEGPKLGKVKTPAKKSMKAKTKDVTASPAFVTACEKIPSKRRNVKSRNTKARKKINFDQQTDTQSQSQSLSLSQRFGNPPKPTYAEVSAARLKSTTYNPVGLLPQTSNDVSSQKTKVSRGGKGRGLQGVRKTISNK